MIDLLHKSLSAATLLLIISGVFTVLKADSPVASFDVTRAPFLAKGDGKKDDLRAIQSALDTAGRKGGGIVFLPAGNYLVSGHLRIPAGTTLSGIARAPQLYDPKTPGSTLLAVEGEGQPNGTPFITMEGPNSILDGITVFYPNQKISEKPLAYPWTIRSGEKSNLSLINVLLVNPYQGVDFSTVGSGRHYIRGLYGQPLYRGLQVDKCYDVGRIHDVHFWPFWTLDKKILDFQIANATAFIFQRTDWEMVEGVFCWGYRNGIEFSASADGAMNGQLTNVGLDAVDVGIWIKDTQGPGISISNLSVANDNNGREHIAILGSPGISNSPNRVITGAAYLYINGGSFWGWWNRIIKWENDGVLSMSSSRFAPFQLNGPMAELLTGQIQLQNNTFSMYPGVKPRAGVGILVGPKVKNASIHDNLMNGLSVENPSGRAVVNNNQ